jgi:general stress protein 26
MVNSASRRKGLDLLGSLIADIPVAMLTTCAPDHSLHTRPMLNINSGFDGDIWIFTHAEDPKVQEIVGNPQVSLSFSDPSSNRYVCVSGLAELVRDRKRAESLWTESCEQWFPKGLDDPGLALLRIDVRRAEYWDEKSSRMHAIRGLFRDRGDARAHEKFEWKEDSSAPGTPK